MPRRSKRHWTAKVVPWGSNKIVAKHPHYEKSAKERERLATSLIKEAYTFHFREQQNHNDEPQGAPCEKLG